MVAVSGAILYETSQSEFTAEQHGQGELLFSTSKLSFLQAFPSICFAYQCHISAVPIYRRNEKRVPPANCGSKLTQERKRVG